ncbi:MAG: response regulator [Leptospirales bacterium]|nr:response regulator [Leptospirales bacterium]
MANVVIIDDDPVSLRITVALIADVNREWTTMGFDSAPAAFDFLEGSETDPLFVIMDVFMPGMDAFDLLKNRSKSASSNYPVFLMSADVTREVAERAAEIPQIRCVFSKPLNPGSLTYHLLMNGIRIH